MGMSFVLRYHQQVVSEDIPALPKKERTRIQKALSEKMTTHPEIFGKPLRRSLKGYRRLRVGEYRVVFRIEQETIKILAIGHRSTVYGDTKGIL
ncbi:MAG: type II toxin-antitoxin system RelE/ParE family toxin [Patescibacteria group bacterium]